MSEPAPSIRFEHVTRRFGETFALRELDLAIRSGSLVCVLGRNGAGKTTALRTIMGLTLPTHGNVWIDGVSVRSGEIHDVRRRLGYLAEDPALYDELTGREFLRFVGELYGVAPAAYRASDLLLERMELTDAADAPIRTYSMGMRKKIAFLAAILHEPRMLILDEPTGGLDAVSARIVKDTMLRYRHHGRVVVFSTHVMELAERWADRIAILDRGRLRFDGSLEELRRRHAGSVPGTASLESLFLRATHRG